MKKLLSKFKSIDITLWIRDTPKLKFSYKFFRNKPTVAAIAIVALAALCVFLRFAVMGSDLLRIKTGDIPVAPNVSEILGGDVWTKAFT